MSKNCFIYIRVSTDKQAKEGASLDTQMAGCTEYALKNNWNIIDSFVEEGISAKNDNRPAFQQMIKRLHEVDIVLCFTQDRLLRSGSTGEFISDLFLRDGKELWCVDKGRVKLESPEDEFLFLLTSIMGRHELKKDSKRIRETMRNITLQGYVTSGEAPFGYKIEEKSTKYKKLLIDEDNAKIVRFIYDEYERTNSINKVVSAVDRSYSNVAHILRNPIYIGLYENAKRGITVEDFAPALIEKEQFFRVQRLLSMNIKRPRNPDRVYLFSSLIKCSECGCGFNGISTRNNYGEYRGYHCQLHYKHGDCSNNKYISEKKLEAMALDALQIEQAKALKIRVSEKKKAPNYKKQREALERKLSKLVDLHLDGIIDKTEYSKRHNKLKQQINELALQEQETSTKPSEALNMLKNASFIDLYNALSPAEKKRFWRGVIKVINIDTNGDCFFEFISLY